ncbi:hypothetical protein ACKUB1_14310 [Methanospirillum stamsii]|nr:hypothetical protein [Methanospirillum stamsii]
MQEPTPEMVRAWKETFETYRPVLKPNNKPIQDVISYLKQKYPVTERTEQTLLRVVIENVTLNEYNAQKIPAGKTPLALVFQVEDAVSGKNLYENQDDIFKGCAIIVGFELVSGYFMVEGSSQLWDELFVFRGLDEIDLTNFYLVAEYVACVKKSGDPDRILIS